MNTVTLKVIQGSLSGQEFTFNERTTCVIGRALDCNILLPDDPAYSTISRYHCLLDINPPDICIRDFGSLNGTYVNGVKIGQRTIDEDIAHAQELIYPEYDLNNGDQIKLGETVFQIARSRDRINDKVDHAKENKADYQQTIQTEVPQVDPLDKINLILGQAEQGKDELISIKGYHIEKELGKGSM